MARASPGDAMTERTVPLPGRVHHAHLVGDLEDILHSVCARPVAPVVGSA